MEKRVNIKTPDNHIIYGVLNTSRKQSNTLAVFVHGLTGRPNQHTFYNAAGLFPKKGVDVFRFSLYTEKKGGRNMSKCTITTHARDLDKVISYFRKKYKKIAVIGHSLGSPTILKSDFSKVDNIVLWDPSCAFSDNPITLKKVKINGREVYVRGRGIEFLLNPKMLKEWVWFDGKNELNLISKISIPLKIITAGKGILIKGGREYYKHAGGPKKFVIIKGAGHSFDEEGVEKELLQETLQWIKKFSK